MTKETSGDTEKRLLAVLVKAADGATLRQWTETYAAENPSFCRATIAQLRERCMPKMDTPEAWQDKVERIFEAECMHYRHRYSFEGKDWEKIGNEMENLFDFLSLMDVTEVFPFVHAAVSAFFRQVDAEYNDDFLDDGCIYVSDAAEKGKELLLSALRSENVPQERKREILKDMDDISHLSMYSFGDYFGMEAFLEQLALALLSDAEAVARLDEMIAKESTWAAYPYIIQKERLLRKMGRAEEAEQLLLQYIDIPAIRQTRVEMLMSAGHYEEGMALIEEVLNPKHGSYRTWLQLQCRYAEEHNDIPRMIKIRRALFVEQGGDVDLYRRLKTVVPTEQWEPLLTGMLDAVRRERWYNHGVLADICVEEGLFSLIADLLPSRDVERLPFISRYAPLMPQPAALLSIFPRIARSYAKTQMERTYYAILAESLKNIRGTEGGQAISEKLVAEFRAQYRRRSAMMQELDKCGL